MDHPMLDYTLLDISWFDSLLLNSSFTVVVQLLAFNAKAFVLLLASFVLLRLLKGSAANRHLLLGLSLMAILLLPVAHHWLPEVHIPIEVSEPVSLQVQITGFTTTLEQDAERGATEGVDLQELFFALCQLFVVCYSFGVMFIWLRILVGNLLLWQVKIRARRVREPLWIEALKRHQRQLSICRTIEIRHTTAIISPMTWGVWRPVIFIPSNARRWPEQLISSTLLHELAHIRRYDWLVQQLARSACALYWINPLSWKALKKLYHYAETACDDIVLNTGLKSSHYASDLLHVARYVFCSHSLSHRYVAPSMATPQEPTQLKDRVTAILNPSIQHTPNTRLRFTITFCLVLCLLLPLSSLRARYVESPVQTAENAVPGLMADEINAQPEYAHLVSDEDLAALKLVKFELTSIAPSLNIHNIKNLASTEINRILTNASPVKEASPNDKAGMDPQEAQSDSAKQALQQIKAAATKLSPQPKTDIAAGPEPVETVFNQPVKEALVKESGNGRKGNEAGLTPPLPAHELQLNAGAREAILNDIIAHSRDRIQDYTREKVVVPKYPRFAQFRGIEGEVLVEFDIDSRGNVVDPRVIDASPAGVFDTSALKAIRKFIFNPQKVNGKPVSVKGAKEKFVFVLRS